MVDDIEPIYREDYKFLMLSLFYTEFKAFGHDVALVDFRQGTQSWILRDALDIGHHMTTPQIKARGSDLVDVRGCRPGFVHRTVNDFMHESPQIDEILTVVQSRLFSPPLYWARQNLRVYFKRRPRIPEDGDGSIRHAFQHFRSADRWPPYEHEFLDALGDLFCGKQVRFVKKWKRGFTLALSMEYELENDVSSVLRRNGTLPEDLFAKETTTRGWLSNSLSKAPIETQVGRRATPLAMLLSVGCITVHNRGYRIAKGAHEVAPRHQPRPVMLELIIPFGLPTMKPVDFHSTLGLDNSWLFFLHFVRHTVFRITLGCHDDRKL